MRSMRATRWQIFRKVEAPSVLPFVFAGLEIAVVYALIGAIVGEFVGSRDGLGVRILELNYALDIAGTFSIFVLLAAIGITLNTTLSFLRKKLLFWSPSDESNAAVSN
jgi:NitT/TauT family transport system permease protein